MITRMAFLWRWYQLNQGLLPAFHSILAIVPVPDRWIRRYQTIPKALQHYHASYQAILSQLFAALLLVHDKYTSILFEVDLSPISSDMQDGLSLMFDSWHFSTSALMSCDGRPSSTINLEFGGVSLFVIWIWFRWHYNLVLFKKIFQSTKNTILECRFLLFITNTFVTYNLLQFVLEVMTRLSP